MSAVESVRTAFAAVAPVEWAAAVLALAYLLLAIRQNAWCWLFAIVSSLLYLVVFARAGLAMQAGLQLFYVAMAVYGWRSWRGTASSEPVAVRRWSARGHASALAGLAVATLVSGWMITRSAPQGWVPYADAAIAWSSVLATAMVARKVIENWLYWVVIDAATAMLAAWQGLVVTAVLFVLYTVLACRGYWQWQRDERAARPALPA